MARVLELKEGQAGPIRQGIWINNRRYRRTEEGTSKIDLWAALANPLALRKSVAQDFASAIGADPEVIEIWVTDVVNDLSVVVALQGPESEIEIRTTFLDLVLERLDPQEGDLHVFPNGCVPEWAQRGERLI